MLNSTATVTTDNLIDTNTYSRTIKVVEELFNNDSLVTTLYVNDEKLNRINSRFNIGPDNTYDYRHEYLDTSKVSKLVSSVTDLKVTTVERHFRTWRANKRTFNSRLASIAASSVD